MLCRLSPYLLVLLLSFTQQSGAVSYHLVGWVNTFVPGGGEALLGNWQLGTLQAVGEIGTFTWGYTLSAKTPLTLDGVPENIPSPHNNGLSQIGKKTCTRRNSRGVCINTGLVSNPSPYTGTVRQTDIDRDLAADVLQEIGIKYHFVNVFDAYRRAGAEGQVDQSSIQSLFSAPFDKESLKDSYVYLALLVSAGFHAYTYFNEGITPASPLTGSSNTFYGLIYGIGYPTGSGAPEEMFYRGFLQNEFLLASGTPWIAIPMSTLLYTLSHSPEAHLSAATSGLYLGTLAYINHGSLKKNIAFHFWSDVIMGVHAILSLQRNQRPSPGDLSGTSAAASIFNMKWEF